MKRIKRYFNSALVLLWRRGISYFKYLFINYAFYRYHQKIISVIAKMNPRKVLKICMILSIIISMVIIILLIRVGWILISFRLLGTVIIISLTIYLYYMFVKLKKLRKVRKLFNIVKNRYTLDTFTLLDTWDISNLTRKKIEDEIKEIKNRELTVGQIDDDGRILGLYGDVGEFSVKESEYVKRKRFKLSVVVFDGKVLVRKEFGKKRRDFLSEWHSSVLLYGKANVPAIHHVIESRTNLVLYKNFVVGKTIRELLVEAGAKILNVETKKDPELEQLSKVDRLRAVVDRGRERIQKVLDKATLRELASQIDCIHLHGITHVSNTFGNILVEKKTGRPWFIDLEGSVIHRSTNTLYFLWSRNKERTSMNHRYFMDLMTENSVREILEKLTKKNPNWYSPIDFGCGLTIGSFWSTDSGTGRWEYLNDHVVSPFVAGKRVLDLGSNNGLMPLMMLRSGAKQVIGLELSPDLSEAASIVHKIFEWRDMRKYNFQLHTMDMRAVLYEDWGNFDVVTAFCSLYYLTAEEMGQVVRRAAQISPVMILQANTATRKEAAAYKSRKSSLEFMQRLLLENGFSVVKISAPKGFGRPLLVGMRTDH